MARLFRALKELFKYLRGDLRIFNFYEVDQKAMRLYSLDWMFGSSVDKYKEFSVAFIQFLVKNFNGIAVNDFLDNSRIPDAIQLKIKIDDSMMNDLWSEQTNMESMISRLRDLIREDLGRVREDHERLEARLEQQAEIVGDLQNSAALHPRTPTPQQPQRFEASSKHSQIDIGEFAALIEQ